jgi:transcriptional regulator with PAS, ATPase and Fis domain
MKEIIYGRNKKFTELMRMASQYALYDYPILLLGETGVGKELMAHFIHRNSTRAKDPFISANCGAIPNNLFESEMFGYEKGAFSGAVSSFKGLIRQAHKGTLFLDEIGDLDLYSQVKLLRFLDSFETRSLGSTRIDTVDVRVISATNIDLEEAIYKGKFRRDLFERLSVLHLNIPSLKDRKEDIPVLAKALVESFGGEYCTELDPLLLKYNWPGNIRQLKNTLIKAYILGNKLLKFSWVERLLQECSSLDIPKDQKGTLADIEKQVIVETLRKCQGNRKETAKALGIAKSTLHGKLKSWKNETQDWPIHRYRNLF